MMQSLHAGNHKSTTHQFINGFFCIKSVYIGYLLLNKLRSSSHCKVRECTVNYSVST